MEDLISISEVCKRYQITSRTLRFYEKEGLINSHRERDTLPRKYASEEVEKLRKILIMRSLNLSIKDIKELFLSDQDISVAIRSKIVVIRTELDNKERQLRNLERAVTLLTEKQDIFQEQDIPEMKSRQLDIAIRATELLLDKQYDEFVELFPESSRKYLTAGFLDAFNEDMKLINGELYKIKECFQVEDSIHVYIQGTENTLLIKYIFHDAFISAFTFHTLMFDCRM